ncbi:hypothetical protein A2U01_0083173, partial [Trifolium medium]|nr:hypothetical protein [Trifolium medium]
AAAILTNGRHLTPQLSSFAFPHSPPPNTTVLLLLLSRSSLM